MPQKCTGDLQKTNENERIERWCGVEAPKARVNLNLKLSVVNEFDTFFRTLIDWRRFSSVTTRYISLYISLRVDRLPLNKHYSKSYFIRFEGRTKCVRRAIHSDWEKILFSLFLSFCKFVILLHPASSKHLEDVKIYNLEKNT